MKGNGSAFACVVLLLLTAAAQEQAALSRGTAAEFSISGRVVHALTGQVLSQAQVTIAGTGSNQTAQSVTTGADGRFAFHGLALGKYALIGYKAGFLRQTYNQHGTYSTAIAVGPNLDSENLVFRLRPEATISGAIVDEAGDPVPDAQVFLFHSGSETGLEETTQRQQVMSDDEGHYRFGHLPPGRYDVVVVAQPWYAQNIIHSHFRLRSLQEKGTEKAGEAQNETQDDAEPTHSPLDVAYPVTYYASGTDPSQATTVTLNVGEHATADVPLSPVPAFHVRIRNPNSQTGIGVQAFQNVFGSEVPLPVMSQSSEGYTQVLGLAPGPVVLEIQQYASGTNVRPDGKLIPPSTKQIPLDVASDLDIDASQASGSRVISGHVTIEAATQLPSRVSIQLHHLGSGADLGAPVSPEGDFQLDSPPIQPGRYVLSTFNNGEAYIRGVTAIGAKVSGRVLEITGMGPVQLRITMARGLAQVNGTAMHDSKPEAGVMVVLVPQHPEDNPYLFRRDQSDSDGTFTLNAVVPGIYTLVAIENGWDSEWRNPAILNSYLKKGQSTEIQPGRKYDLNVNVQ